MSEQKEDKRKVTSSKNLAKARQAKLDKLKEKKEKQEYQFEDESSDSSSSDEDVIVVKPKPRKKKQVPQKQEPTNDLAEIKELLTSLATKKKKSKPKRSKQVIQIVNPPVEQKKPSPELEAAKKRILLNFN